MPSKDVQMREARISGDKSKKPYLLAGADIKELTPYIGACYATDRILIDGSTVGYMYREEPDFPEDSGWRFLAGDETQEYIDDQWNAGLFSVNTIANYDESILPFLDSPVGTAYVRDPESGRLQPELSDS